MKPAQRLYTAISGGIPDRVPVVPKIWVDLAGALTGTPTAEILASPETALKVIARAGLLCRVDAVRQFHFPERRIEERGGRLFEKTAGGETLGEIDVQGGLATRLDDPGDFDFRDPLYTAYCQFWSCAKPLIKDNHDADQIAVPAKQFYFETGCGKRQRHIIEEIGDEIGFIGDCGPATMAFLVYLRTMNEALFDLIERPDLAHKILEKGARIAVEKGKFNLDLGIKVLRVNDSIGNMSVISPEFWREFVFPHLRDVCTELHAYDPDARVYCHICGNILPVAEDLVRTGLDCIGPLDPLGGSTPEEVRKRIGCSAALMGGVNTLTFIDGTPQAVIDEARQCILQAGKTGGYILGSGCVVPRSAPVENLSALRTAADRYGLYIDGNLSL
jgi:hypothetical protein